MTSYTLGFIFNSNLSKVLLIHKLTPAWQKGKINGVGGKFEPGEDCYACISRETEEESDLQIPPGNWIKVGELHSPSFQVDVFFTIYPGSESDAKTMENQEVEWFCVSDLPDNIVGNLKWLIPFCLDKIRDKELEDFIVNYK